MNSIRILDCTLRDGGYCNQWNFGEENMVRIISGLDKSGIEIVECGFISNKVSFDKNKSKFPDVESASRIIPEKKHDSLYVAMINYGEYDANDLPEYSEGSMDGIRIAFHKKNVIPALNFCKEVGKKGYKVFIQPMVSMAYSDSEFLDLISRANEIEPYAFYIVDSFGMMRKKDMCRFFSLIENNLNDGICVGFHSHNNLQLAYSNASTLVDQRSGRKLIIDSSIYGMGRGAGNLNTELFIDYLNSKYSGTYDLKPILSIMDEVINRFYLESPWGYTLPNYLSAIHNAHPNYAGYFSDKNTLTVEMMDTIFSRMDSDRKVEFDREYAEQLYQQCMSADKTYDANLNEFSDRITGKKVLLIGPGKSSSSEKEKIIEFMEKEDAISISVNFPYPHHKTDYIFVSNPRRFENINSECHPKYIVTSNITCTDPYVQIDYNELTNDLDVVKDNAGLMAINMLMKFNIDSIMIAGFDGYSYDAMDNFADNSLSFIVKKTYIDAMNDGMEQMIKEYSQHVKISFLTKPKHYRI